MIRNEATLIPSSSGSAWSNLRVAYRLIVPSPAISSRESRALSGRPHEACSVASRKGHWSDESPFSPTHAVTFAHGSLTDRRRFRHPSSKSSLACRSTAVEANPDDARCTVRPCAQGEQQRGEGED